MRQSAEQRAAVVGEFRRRGLSDCHFERLAGMKYPTLMEQVKSERGCLPGIRKADVKQRPILVEAVVGGFASTMRIAPPLRVHLGGGVLLELADANPVALAA